MRPRLIFAFAFAFAECVRQPETGELCEAAIGSVAHGGACRVDEGSLRPRERLRRVSRLLRRSVPAEARHVRGDQSRRDGRQSGRRLRDHRGADPHLFENLRDRDALHVCETSTEAHIGERTIDEPPHLERGCAISAGDDRREVDSDRRVRGQGDAPGKRRARGSLSMTPRMPHGACAGRDNIVDRVKRSMTLLPTA
jgi:hypothetical protein